MENEEYKSYEKLKRRWIDQSFQMRLPMLGVDTCGRGVKENLKEFYSQNPARFINDNVWTFDPRNIEIDKPTKVPLLLFPVQEDLIEFVINDCMSHSENGLIEKSRDMGLTWLMISVFVHQWLFKSGFKAGIGSRKRELVDKLGDMDAIFPKIRWVIDNLPGYLKPKGYRVGIHDNYTRIINPYNGSVITGDGGDNIGRGGRSTVYFVDEHAFIERAESADASLSQNTNCIIYGSTVNGTSNLFYKKRNDGSTKVFVMDWRQHPMKNQDWYDDYASKFDSVTVASEVDRDYSASVEGIVIPAHWVKKCIDLDLPGGFQVHAGADVGGGTGNSGNESVYVSRNGPTLIKLHPHTTSDPTDFAQKIAREAHKDKAGKLIYDHIGVGAGIGGAIKKMDQKFRFKLIPFRSGDRPTELNLLREPCCRNRRIHWSRY